MKILAALVTALALVGFGGAALRLRRLHEARGDTAQTDGKIIPPADKTS